MGEKLFEQMSLEQRLRRHRTESLNPAKMSKLCFFCIKFKFFQMMFQFLFVPHVQAVISQFFICNFQIEINAFTFNNLPLFFGD